MLFIYGKFYCSSCFPFKLNVLCRNLLLPCEANISRTLSSAVGLKMRPGLSSQTQRAAMPAWLVRGKHPDTPVSHHVGVVWFRSLRACWCCSDGEQQHFTRQDVWRQPFSWVVFLPGGCLFAYRWCWWDSGICSHGLWRKFEKKFVWGGEERAEEERWCRADLLRSITVMFSISSAGLGFGGQRLRQWCTN